MVYIMITYSTFEARGKFAEIIDKSIREPVAIARHGRVVSVMMAKEDYDRAKKIEEEWWMNYKTIPAEDVTDEVDALIEQLETKLQEKL
jgi:PHD/YefM family antitoxin component YafN of YafNO toxin-antitoxin module